MAYRFISNFAISDPAISPTLADGDGLLRSVRAVRRWWWEKSGRESPSEWWIGCVLRPHLEPQSQQSSTNGKDPKLVMCTMKEDEKVVCQKQDFQEPKVFCQKALGFAWSSAFSRSLKGTASKSSFHIPMSMASKQRLSSSKGFLRGVI